MSDIMLEAFKAMNQPQTQEVVEEVAPIIEEEQPKVDDAVNDTPSDAVNDAPQIEEEQPKQVEQVVEKAPKKEIEFKNEYSKDLYEAIRSKELDKVKDILDKGFYDASKLDAHSVAVQMLKAKNPNWSDEDIADELNDTYAFGKLSLTEDDKDGLTDEQISAYEKELKKGERAFKKLVSEGREYLNSTNRVELELPDFEFAQQETVPEGYMSKEEWVQAVQQENQEFYEKASKDFDNDMASYGKSKSYTVNLGTSESKEDFQVKFELTDRDFDKLYKKVADMASGEYFNRFKKPDGSFDFKAVADDLLYNDLTEKLLTSSLKEIKAVSQKNLIKDEIKNYKSPTGGGSVQQSNDADYQVSLMRFR